MQKIKETAIKLFAEKGYHGTSVKEITSGIGITPPALYAHVSSKESLFLALFKECFSEGIKEVREVLAEKDTYGSYDGLLHDIFVRFIASFTSNPDKANFVLHSVLFPPVELREKIISVNASVYGDTGKQLKALFKLCIDAGTVRDLTIQEHYDNFYRSIYSFIFINRVMNSRVTKEKIEEAWVYYWQIAKNK